MTALPLFRAEAIEHRRRGEHAGVPLPAPPPPAWLGWGLVGAVLLALTLAAGADYARKTRVSGYLAPPSGVARVLPPRAGVIARLDVRDGDLVAAGDVLLTIRSGGADAAGGDVDLDILAALDRQRARLDEQAATATAQATREAARLRDALAALGDEYAALQTEARLQTQRAAIAQAQLDAARGLLAGGNISRIEYQRRQDAVLAQVQATAALSRALAAKQAERAAAAHALAALPDTLAAQVAALRAQMADTDTRRADARGRQAVLLRAPIGGRVTALQAAVGQAANPALPLLAIVPADEALRAELLVPARAIGEVRPGQVVRLAIDAFPAARFGLARGRVVSVSRSLLRPAELAGPLVASEPCYRVSVALEAQTIGEALPLVPDLTVSAAIVIDRHSLLGWLLEPLRARAQGRA